MERLWRAMSPWDTHTWPGGIFQQMIEANECNGEVRWPACKVTAYSKYGRRRTAGQTEGGRGDDNHSQCHQDKRT